MESTLEIMMKSKDIFLAELMTKKGYTSSVKEALDDYIGDYGKHLAWEPFDHQSFISYENVIDNIHRVNGLVILAHPLNYNLKEEELQKLMTGFQKNNGDAVEVYYGAYSKEQKIKLKAKSDALGLGYSCGSDFHGFDTQETMLHHFSSEIYYQLLRIKKYIS